MKKSEFIAYMKDKLKNYPEAEVDKALEFYVESIDDRLEDGMDEDEAVESIGSLEDIEKNIKSDMPMNAIVKNKIDQRKHTDTTTVLLLIIIALLTFPVWFPILMTVGAVIIGIVATVFGLGIAAVATAFALCIAGIATVIGGVASSATVPMGAYIISFGAILLGIGLIIPTFNLAKFVILKLVEGIKWCIKKIKRAIV